VAELLQWGRERLSPARTASLDAQLLLAHVLRRERAWLIGHDRDLVPQATAAAFTELVERRRTGEPVAYIRGHVDWFGMELVVSPAVLVPRPETELLVERAAALIRERGVHHVVDVGTGSGAIAIGLATLLPRLRISAVDVSDAALVIARLNVQASGHGGRICLLRGHLLEPLTERPDVVVANLPYLSTEMYAQVDADVRHEPALALVAGATGLELYEELLIDLQNRGWALPTLLEIDPRQAEDARALADRVFPDAAVTIERDYAGLDRMMVIEP
jgi:release factor glutamine methyltransferase